MRENRGSTLFSFLILIVLAAGVYYIVKTVQETADKTLSPVQQANSALQTQVSDLMHPTPTIIPDPVTYINQIQALARLETIQYSVEQVVTAETNQGTFAFAFGNQILVQIHGTVIAGIDMQKLAPEDMQLQNGLLSVKLPPAEIFTVTVDENKTQVYNIQTGVFAKTDPNLVISALQSGKDKITTSALDDGILTQAQKNAEAYLSRFFAALGYPNTIFVE
jgi:hypothetical protein